MSDKERVRIYPAGKEQMECRIAKEKDLELKEEYKEMLQECGECRG